jgi:hypothetical protein
MSKIKALITTLVLGTSSIALADPGFAVRDHRDDVRTAMYRPARPSWIALSSPMMIDSGKNAIKLATPSRYSQLRLQATAGSSYIKSLTVRFSDGTKQELAINKTLDPRSPMIELPVSSRASVDRVVIKGSTNRRASVQLFGTSALVAHR